MPQISAYGGISNSKIFIGTPVPRLMREETRKLRRGDVGYTVGRIYFPILISHFAIFLSNINCVLQCIFDFLAIIARKEIVLHRPLMRR